MTTDAEEAAGRELREKSFPMQPFSVKWEDLKPEIRSEWIRDAMDIVRAYERAAWRPIAPDDPTDVKFLMSYSYPGGGWSKPYECSLRQLGEPRYKPELLRIRIMPEGPEI